MNSRILCGTDIRVSPICLGTMLFGNPVSEERAIELTHWAIDHGINFIDTANMYEGYDRIPGSPGGVAEEILGKALAGRRDKVVLATKVGNAVGNGRYDKGLSRSHITRELEKSLKRMRTDYVDIYYLHRPDPDTPIAESLAVLNKFIDSGKVRWYGFSNYGETGIQEMLRACEAGGLRRPVVCQPPYSLLKRDVEKDVLPVCRREGIAVVPYQVLQGGLLTGKYRRDRQPPSGSRMAEKQEWMGEISDVLFDRLESIEREAKAEGRTMTQHAVAWALRQSGIASVVIGAKRPDQLAEAIAAAESV